MQLKQLPSHDIYLHHNCISYFIGLIQGKFYHGLHPDDFQILLSLLGADNVFWWRCALGDFIKILIVYYTSIQTGDPRGL